VKRQFDQVAISAKEQRELGPRRRPGVPPLYSEERLALRFSEEQGDALRYTPSLGKWYSWDGRRWKLDDDLTVLDRVRNLCRTASAECRKDDRLRAHGYRIATNKTVTAVERLVRTDRRHILGADQWDADPWALNTPGGKVDLRTGVIQPSSPRHHCTKMTAIAPDGDCLLWHSFLSRITGGDKDYQQYLQRVAGYALTGSTKEQAMFVLHGTGGNGKGVFLETIASVMGDYATSTPPEVFMATQGDQHPTELARLRSARLVIASETEEGRPWAIAKVKRLTGGDRIAARFMHQDFFEFQPQFKLIIAGNHRPSIRIVDEATRRRIHLLPFFVTIPQSERDPDLKDKLRAEWPGILAWMIKGCLAWQREGLNPPRAVAGATHAYLAEEDTPGRWIEECCDQSPGYSSTSRDLFADWERWCKENGEHPGSQKSFSQVLGARGFERTRTRDTRGFQGIQIKSADRATNLVSLPGRA
jgi:putative DNA primase/helicase